MRARKYTYIPNAEIESITTWNGKEIPGSKLLDGAYARGKVQYRDGGMMAKGGINGIYEGSVRRINGKDYLINESVLDKFGDIVGWNAYEIVYDTKMGEKHINYERTKKNYNQKYFKNNMALLGDDVGREYFMDGGMMAKGGEVYKIQQKYKYELQPKWEDEKFQTGGRYFLSFKDAQDFKKKLSGMSSSMEYKVIKVEDKEQYADGGVADDGYTYKIEKIKMYRLGKDNEKIYFDGWSADVFFNGDAITTIPAGQYDTKEEIEDRCKRIIKELKAGTYKGYNLLDERYLRKMKDTYADGGMMARGGYASRHRKRTLEEKAQEMYGSDWFDLDERTRKELIDDLRITKGEKGLIVGDKYVATFTLANGKTIKKSYSTKDELDEGIGEMYSDYDVIDVKIEETKVKEEPKEEKKGIFKLAKITEKTTSKGKEKRQGVAIEGIESDISRYEELKAIMKNAKAESDLIGGRIKELGSQKWLELYEQSGNNPNSIDLIDGDENIMLQVKDGYKKVEPEKRAILQENYPDLLETTIVYTMDTALLDKYGEVITNLINNSKDIEEKDKDKLVKGESTTTIKKGSIDKILNYPNPEEVFILIEPTMALY